MRGRTLHVLVVAGLMAALGTRCNCDWDSGSEPTPLPQADRYEGCFRDRQPPGGCLSYEGSDQPSSSCYSDTCCAEPDASYPTCHSDPSACVKVSVGDSCVYDSDCPGGFSCVWTRAPSDPADCCSVWCWPTIGGPPDCNMAYRCACAPACPGGGSACNLDPDRCSYTCCPFGCDDGGVVCAPEPDGGCGDAAVGDGGCPTLACGDGGCPDAGPHVDAPLDADTDAPATDASAVDDAGATPDATDDGLPTDAAGD
jgi:hypothetical protein